MKACVLPRRHCNYSPWLTEGKVPGIDHVFFRDRASKMEVCSQCYFLGRARSEKSPRSSARAFGLDDAAAEALPDDSGVRRLMADLEGKKCWFHWPAPGRWDNRIGTGDSGYPREYPTCVARRRTLLAWSTL